MEQAKIDRINALARKAKTEGLTEAEKRERALLRREYLDAVKANLEAQLAHTYLYGKSSEQLEMLRTAYKSAFYLLMPLHYLRTGDCLTTRRSLREALTGEEQAILSVGCDWFSHQASFATHPDWHFDRLIRWYRQLLTNPIPTRQGQA